MIPGWNNTQLTIRAWYGTTDVNRLAKNLRMTVDEVHAEAERMGMRVKHRSLREMADAARSRAELNAANPKPEPKSKLIVDKRRAHAERLNQIIKEFPTTPNVLLAAKHGYSMSRIAQLGRRYGLQKNDGCRKVADSNAYRCTRKPTVKAVRETYNALKQGDTLTALHILAQFFKEPTT